jgi:hypothetical protein
MTRHEMADLIDRLDAGPVGEQIAAANIRQAALRGYNFVMQTTERQRDCWFPCSFRNRHHQELAATASVLVACELQLIVEIFPLKPGMEGTHAYA